MKSLRVVSAIGGLTMLVIGAIAQCPVVLPSHIKMTLWERIVAEFENNRISYTCFAFGVLFFIVSSIVHVRFFLKKGIDRGERGSK